MSNHHLDSATCCFVHGFIGFVGFSSFVLVFTGFSISFVFNLVGDSPKIQNTHWFSRGYPRLNQKIKKYIRSANFILIWVLIFYIVLVPVYLQTSFNL